MFIPTEELSIPIGIPNKEAKAQIETHPVTVEAKISKCSVKYFLFHQCFLI